MIWRDCIFDPPPPNETQLVRSGGSYFFAAWSKWTQYWYDVGGRRQMDTPPLEWLGPEQMDLLLF